MKAKIHPTYHSDAKIICSSCGAVLTTGSTVPEMRIEVCANCHPFYTGKQNLVDTAGRVDRFRRLVSQRDTTRAKRAASKKAKKTDDA